MELTGFEYLSAFRIVDKVAVNIGQTEPGQRSAADSQKQKNHDVIAAPLSIQPCNQRNNNKVRNCATAASRNILACVSRFTGCERFRVAVGAAVLGHDVDFFA